MIQVIDFGRGCQTLPLRRISSVFDSQPINDNTSLPISCRSSTMKKKEKTTSEVAFLMGICILPVGTLGYTAGLASPYQRFGRDGAGVRKVYGLWTTCDQVSGDLVNCQDNVLTVGGRCGAALVVGIYE